MTATFMGNTFRGEFNIIRFVENSLINSTIAIDLDLELEDDPDIEQVRSLGRMRKWLDSIFEGCIAVNIKSDMPMETLISIDNHLMFCHDDPYDFNLLLLIHSKLTAIGAGKVWVKRIHLSSDMGDGFGNWFEGDSSSALPSAADWFGEKTFFDKPWWQRPDGGMIDMWAGPDDDISKKPDILIDLADNVASDSEDSIISSTKPADIIKPNFKPIVIVNNDKTE